MNAQNQSEKFCVYMKNGEMTEKRGEKKLSG